MLKRKYFLILILLNLLPTVSYAQELLPDLYWDISESYSEHEIIEASLLLQSPEGFLYRISKMNTDGQYSILMVDSSYPNIVPAYWGERHINAVLMKIKEMWGEVKAYVIQILERVKDMMGILGVILIFLLTGILTYFINLTFPAFPQQWVFYSVYTLVCLGWIYLTSIWTSVVWGTGILILPYLIISLMGVGYRRLQEKFKNKKYA